MNRLHRYISLLVIGLIVVHVAATALDAMGDSWHTLIIGADVQHYGWMRPALWLAQAPLLALFCYRLLSPAARSRSTTGTVVRYGVAVASAAALVAVVVIVATGHYAAVVPSIQ